MKKRRRIYKNLLLGTLSSLSIILNSLGAKMEVSANNLTYVSEENPPVEVRNNLIFAQNIDLNLKPTIESTAGFERMDVSAADIAAPKIENNKIYGWSQLRFSRPLSASDNIVVHYPISGTYNGKNVSLKLTLFDFYKSGASYYNTVNSNDAVTTLFINDLGNNGIVFRGLETFKTRYQFYTEDGSVVSFNNDAFINFNSLNGYDEATLFNQTKLKDNPYFNKYAHISEGISYLNKDVSSQIYALEKGNIKQYSLDELSPGNPTQITGALFAGASNDFEDVLGAATFTKNTISYQIKGNAPEFFVVASRGSAWIAPSGATLFNTLPEAPIKSVSDSDEQNVTEDKLNDLDDGIANGVTYKITQKVGTLGNDLLTKYSEFSFKDVLHDVYDMKTVQIGVFMGDKAEDVTNKFDVFVENHTVIAKAKSELLSDFSIYDGRTFTLKIDIKVDENKASSLLQKVSSIQNVANVSINNTPQMSNKVATLVSRKPLEISKTVNREIAQINEEILYTITVINDEFVEQKGEIVDDMTDILEQSEYIEGSLEIDGVKQTDSKDADNAEVTKHKISARITVSAKGQTVLRFKTRANKPTLDDKMINVAILKTRDGEIFSNEVQTIIPELQRLQKEEAPIHTEKEIDALPKTGKRNTYLLFTASFLNVFALIAYSLGYIIHMKHKENNKSVTTHI